MRLAKSGFLALLVLLTACAPHGTLTPPRVKAAGTTALTGGNPAPDATRSAAVGANLAGPLRKPSTLGATISGVLTIDAAYAVSSGAAILANNGSSLIGKVKASDLVSDQDTGLVSDHGGGLISDHGNGLVSNNTGNLIANNSGNIVSSQGLGLISDSGLGLIGKVKLISDQGAGLISNNGGGLVSNNGGSLIGKVKYGLAGASARASRLPAANMVVGAVSMVDGHPVPVGVDAAGQPVYAIYTDAAGRYTLYLPKGLAHNVRLVARPAEVEDARLEYGTVLAPGDNNDASMDEATALAAAYFRVVMVARIADILSRDNGDESRRANALGKLPVLLQGQFKAVTEDLLQAADTVGLRNLSPALQRGVILGAADALCAFTDLSTITSDAKIAGAPDPGLALPNMARFLVQISDRTAAVLAKDPKYFESRPYLIAANRARAAEGRPLFHVQKPSDLGAFIVREYLTSNVGETADQADLVLEDLGMSRADRRLFQAASVGIYEALGVELVTQTEAQEAVKAAFRTGTAAARLTPPEALATPVPGDRPPSPAPTPETVDVSTLVGTGVAGFADGQGAKAQFDSPEGIIFDTTAPTPTLYVADGNNMRIRQVVIDASGSVSVSTIAGGGAPGNTDGPGAAARFVHPYGLALAPDRKLYVADRDGHRIRVVDLASKDFNVSTIAGTGVAAFADGPGSVAAFSGPSALCLDNSGHLIVAEVNDPRVRAISLSDAAHPVTTLFGTGSPGREGGAVSQASIFRVAGFAYIPDGSLVFTDAQTGLIRKLLPDGTVSLVAGGGRGGAADGLWANAGFFGPAFIAIDSAGTLLLTDRTNNRIREITAPGDVRTLAGSGPSGNDGTGNFPAGGFADGPGQQARFDRPTGIAIDAQGNVYVSEDGGHRIRKITRRP